MGCPSPSSRLFSRLSTETSFARSFIASCHWMPKARPGTQLASAHIRQEACLIFSSNTHSKVLTLSSCRFITPGCTRSPQEKPEWWVPWETPTLAGGWAFPRLRRAGRASAQRPTASDSISKLSLWERATTESFAESLLSTGPNPRFFFLTLNRSEGSYHHLHFT